MHPTRDSVRLAFPFVQPPPSPMFVHSKERERGFCTLPTKAATRLCLPAQHTASEKAALAFPAPICTWLQFCLTLTLKQLTPICPVTTSSFDHSDHSCSCFWISCLAAHYSHKENSLLSPHPKKLLSCELEGAPSLRPPPPSHSLL